MQDAIRELIERGTIDAALATGAMEEIMSGSATPAQMGAFLTALRLRGETAEIIAACARVMQAHAEAVPISDVIDVVGTGGDGRDTINVSTAAAIVVAGAGGRVAKHGNRAASSKAGSADVLEALGAKTNLGGLDVARVIEACGFCFVFAQRFHPSMRHVGGVRRELAVRTIFNVLGPLTNPARPRGLLAGAGVKSLAPVMAEAFALRGMERTIVVHSADGLDEISPAGATHAWFVDGGVVSQRDLHPSDFGLPEHPLESVFGGSPEYNAGKILAVLDGIEGPEADFVVMNAAAACYVAGLAPDLATGTLVAQQAIASGRAREVLDHYVALTREVADA